MKQEKTDVFTSTQSDTKEQQTNSSAKENCLIETIENTPFALVELNNKKRLVLGNILINELNYNRTREASEYLNKINAKEIMNIAGAMIQLSINNLKDNKNE